ncbi:MAG: RDD family protein [Actinomycetota bacterium]
MPYCSYCGHEISQQAVTCPNCGHPNESRTVVPEVAFQPPGPGAQYAGFWIRFLSLLIDGIIIGIVTAPFGTVHTTSGNYVFVFNPLRNIGQFVYAWLMIALVNGQTLGMMVCGIRITRPNGDTVDLGRSAGRALMAYVSGVVLALGYLWMLWDPEKRTWHDIVADTRVYKVRR